MSKQTVYIEVGSMPHVGKSTIAEVIAEKLEELGFIVSLVDDQGYGASEPRVRMIDQRMQAMIDKGTPIEIRTRSHFPGG